MWAHAFCDSQYYAAVDTNNGTESLNKTVKYSYLPRRKSLTLSGIASLLIDRFFARHVAEICISQLQVV